MRSKHINNKTFKHPSLIFAEPFGESANEIMLIIMQNSKPDFLENEFWVAGVCVLSSISRILYNFSTVCFSMYGGILKLKNSTSILRKNDSLANKTFCTLKVR